MKCYGLDTVFNFGKHKGKTLEQVFCTIPSYIDWCLREVSYFEISYETFDYLKRIKPKYFLSPEAHKSIVSKETRKQDYANYQTENNFGDHEFMRHRISQHQELQGRDESDAISLLELSDEIGCDPEDLIANLDM